MRAACPHFVGKKDFTSCMAQGSSITDAVRTVQSLAVEKNGREILIRIRADGFLYNMVRIIAGTIVDVGLGKIDAKSIPEIIESKERTKAGKTLPPHGLYLVSVNYEE